MGKLREWGVVLIIGAIIASAILAPAYLVKKSNEQAERQLSAISANQALVQDVLDHIEQQQDEGQEGLRLAVTAATDAITCALLIEPSARTQKELDACVNQAFNHIGGR